MGLVKLGELLEISQSDVHAEDSYLYDPAIIEKMADESEIIERFKKTAADLKQIAPKAKDFLYFSAIMMHAAEASALNVDGSFKKDAKGNDVVVGWEETGESLKWSSSDSNVKPYKNSNNDIFPEKELLLAYKKWVGKPLCLDHKSSSVDMIRGVIVDTFYDRKHKRVIALCALDKQNYPDLARKVSTGYAACVSMGTGVSKAICTDCGKVARVESEFCSHMVNKSCYGEVNIGLNPIELSIVVNGADPQAKIRYIIAAADSMAQYVEMKHKEFDKIAEVNKDTEIASQIEDCLTELDTKLSDLKDKIRQLKAKEDAEVTEENKADDAVVAEAAGESDPLLKIASSKIEDIFSQMRELNEKFTKFTQLTEDTSMTEKKAYYQGAGGVNEPARGQVKYPKEEADKIRDTQDKHMDAQDTGPVDGMFPGDEAKKRELQRLAEVTARDERRKAALAAAKDVLQKGAYHQGGGGPNDPAAGKKYTKEDSDKIRDKEDRHMVGNSPFPSVGKVDGLFGNDLETKKKLSRASLKAKFVKAANSDGAHDLGNSCWQVFADGSLILSASVNEITGKKASTLYGSVATKEFGRDMLSRIKTEGFDKAVALYKGAQMAPQAAPPAPAAPAGDPLAGPMADPMAMPGAEEPAVDGGDSGDPKEAISDIAQQLSNLAADLAEADKALSSKSDELKGFDELAQVATAEYKPLFQMQKRLAASIRTGIKSVQEEIREHMDELKLAHTLVSDRDLLKTASAERKVTIKAIVGDSVGEAKRTVADGFKLMAAFVKYARGTQNLVKRVKKAQTVTPSAKMPEEGKELADTMQGFMKDPAPSRSFSDAAAGKPAPKPATRPLQQGSGGVREMTPEEIKKIHEEMGLADDGQDSCMADDGKDKDEDCEKDENDLKAGGDGSLEGTPEEIGKALKAKSASDLTTKAGRAEARAKLAEKAAKTSNVLTQAHGTTGPVVAPAADNNGKVETLDEVQKAMLDIANAPPKVRKQAAEIQQFVVSGAIKASEVEGLVAQGLDADAVKYWKAYYGQSKDGGSQFAAELVNGHAKAKVAEEQEAFKVKVARAHEVAQEMKAHGILSKEASAYKVQVEEMITWTDAQFDSVQRVLAKMPMSKQASALPLVGMGGDEVYVPAPEAAPQGNMYTAALDSYFASPGKKLKY